MHFSRFILGILNWKNEELSEISIFIIPITYSHHFTVKSLPSDTRSHVFNSLYSFFENIVLILWKKAKIYFSRFICQKIQLKFPLNIEPALWRNTADYRFAAAWLMMHNITDSSKNPLISEGRSPPNGRSVLRQLELSYSVKKFQWKMAKDFLYLTLYILQAS